MTDLFALLGASDESIRRWNLPFPVDGIVTAETVADAKDAVGALRGWWPRGHMPIQFRNAKPWKTKEELADIRRLLAGKIGVHVNTLRVLWRKREIPPLPPDGNVSRGYIATVENHPIIKACKLTATKKELAARVGESVPTLHHLWRHGTIPPLPDDGKLTTEYVREVKSRANGWRTELREQKKLTAQRKMKAATRNREAAQKRELFEALKSAGFTTTRGTIGRWLRKEQIPELPEDGSLPLDYIQAVINFAKCGKERHRENTRLAQNRPGVQRRKSASQKRAARRPEVRAAKSANKKNWWEQTNDDLAAFHAGKTPKGTRGGSKAGWLKKGTPERITLAADLLLRGVNPWKMPPDLYPIHFSEKRSDKKAAWDATSTFLRNNKTKIQKRMADLAALSEFERQVVVSAAREVVKTLS